MLGRELSESSWLTELKMSENKCLKKRHKNYPLELRGCCHGRNKAKKKEEVKKYVAQQTHAKQ